MSSRRHAAALTAVAASLLVISHRAAAQAAAPDTMPVQVTGTVRDSVSGLPLAGAVVEMMAEARPQEARSVRTDSAGVYVFPGVRPGMYVMDFLHPTLDALGIEPPTRRVAVAPGGPARVELATPGGPRIRAALCGDQAAGDSSGALVGAVRDADTGLPLPGAKVVLTWRQLTLDAAGLRMAEQRRPGTARADGAFTLCDVPSDIAVVASAEAPGRASGLVELTVPARGLLLRDLTLGDSATAAPVAVADSGGARRTVRRGSARLAGVVRDTNNRPVRGATVLVLGTSGTARTGDDGRFAVEGLPAGTYSLEARAIGFAPARVAVDLASATTRSTAVRLERPATTLSAVVVKGKRDVHSRALEEFLQRRNRGFGRYVTAEDIERQRPIYVTDALRTLPGIRVSPNRSGFGQTITARANCEPTVYVDGMRMFGGAADLDSYLRPGDVAGIEVYSGGAGQPAQFQGACAIAIWTKR